MSLVIVTGEILNMETLEWNVSDKNLDLESVESLIIVLRNDILLVPRFAFESDFICAYPTFPFKHQVYRWRNCKKPWVRRGLAANRP